MASDLSRSSLVRTDSQVDFTPKLLGFSPVGGYSATTSSSIDGEKLSNIPLETVLQNGTLARVGESLEPSRTWDTGSSIGSGPGLSRQYDPK